MVPKDWLGQLGTSEGWLLCQSAEYTECTTGIMLWSRIICGRPFLEDCQITLCLNSVFLYKKFDPVPYKCSMCLNICFVFLGLLNVMYRWASLCIWVCWRHSFIENKCCLYVKYRLVWYTFSPFCNFAFWSMNRNITL